MTTNGEIETPQENITTSEGRETTLAHGDHCPHCAMRRALQALLTSVEPSPAWDHVVACMTLCVAEMIGANPSADERLRAMIYVRRWLPTMVAVEEQDYSREHPNEYEIAATKGTA